VLVLEGEDRGRPTCGPVTPVPGDDGAHVLGQLEAVGEVTGGDAAMQIGGLRGGGALAAGDLQAVLFDELKMPKTRKTKTGYTTDADALAGLRALPGWAEAPNPVHADDLLPERLLAGDELACEQILNLVHAPLHEMGETFESTVATYLALGGSLSVSQGEGRWTTVFSVPFQAVS